MSTAGDLLNECISQLHGWGGTSDRVTPLASVMDTSSTTFTVDASYGPANGLNPGVVEIDSELIYVQSVDPNSNNAQISTAGRGYNGTAITAHNPGVMVISRPRYPRWFVLKTMNEVLGGLFPDLFAINTWTGTVTTPSNTYIITDSQGNQKIPLFIIDAQWQTPIGNWARLPAFSVDPFDGAFRLGGHAMIGRPLRIMYATEPQMFVSESDDFVTATGLPPSCADVLMLGTLARFVIGQDLARGQITSVEQSDRARLVPPGTAENSAKWLTANFQQRLTNEALSLRKRYKPRIVRTW